MPRFGLPVPVQAKAKAVPLAGSLGLLEDQQLLRVGLNVLERKPEEPI
jgi:hypothetical protein